MNGTVKLNALAPIAILCASGAGLHAAGQPSPYTAVQVDRFIPSPGVAFPADYQNALVDDIAREISLAFPTVILLREGDPAPDGHGALRISGTVTSFQPGNRTKRALIGFGAGATMLKAQVRFADAVTSRILLNREVTGMTWMGIAGGDSHGAAGSLARTIVKLAKTDRLIDSK